MLSGLKKIISSDTFTLGLASGLLLFLKLGNMQLPYFWDEAWSYLPAVQEMAEKGPSLMPGAIPGELYRGHPVLFYFLAASWMRLFGGSIPAMRLFAMLWAALLLWSVYFFVKKNFDKRLALFVTCLLLIQSVFLAQASFLLPEVLVALFSVLALSAYFAEKNWTTTVWLALLLLTKESGIVLWSVLIFSEIFLKTGRSWPERLKRSGQLSLALIPVGLFFLVQKAKLGWLLFPEHLGYLKFSIPAFFKQLSNACSYLFIDMGRNLLTLGGVACAVFLLLTKRTLATGEKEKIRVLTLFVFVFLIFSAFNFFSPRYLLCVLPFSLLVFSWLIFKGLGEKTILLFLLLAVIFLNNAYFTFFKLRGSDHNLGFVYVVKNQQEAVHFCEKSNFRDKRITTGFLMQKNLTDQRLGYLTGPTVFSNVETEMNPGTEIAIVTSIDDKSLKHQVAQAGGRLIKRFELKNAWTEVYEIP